MRFSFRRKYISYSKTLIHRSEQCLLHMQKEKQEKLKIQIKMVEYALAVQNISNAQVVVTIRS